MLLMMVNGFRYSLAEIFEIWQGIAPPIPTKNELLNANNIYKMVYPADLGQVFKSLYTQQLAEFGTEREIKREKLLTADDYLISCKGIIKGFSLQHSEIAPFTQIAGSFKGVLASNQFIVVRPRPSFKEMYGVPYLHNILDILIPKMNEMTDSSIEKKRLRYITIKDISYISIELPVKECAFKREEFESLHHSWKESLKQFTKMESMLRDHNLIHLNDLKIEIALSYEEGNE